MSILDKNIDMQPDPVQESANRLIMMTKHTFNQMVNRFNEGSRIFWENPRGVSPEAIAEKLGSDAAEVFMLHYKLGHLISEVKPEAISYGLSVIGNFTMNEDGTVTVITTTPEPTPEPTPE
jgi:hypothetical protein